MYSPGSLKVAEVEAVPLTPPPPASTLASSTVGFASLKVTTPGPRNLLHVRTTGGVFGGFIPQIFFPIAIVIAQQNAVGTVLVWEPTLESGGNALTSVVPRPQRQALRLHQSGAPEYARHP